MVELLNIILRHRRKIVLFSLTASVVVGVLTLLQPRTYSASASFMPQASESRSGSGAAALARQFGVNIGGGDRAGGSPQFYADMLKTRKVLQEAAESKYRIDTDGHERSATLVELYKIEGTDSKPAWQGAIERLQDNLSISVSRETGVIKLSVSSFAPDLAEQILGRLLELVNDFNLESRQIQAQQEGQFISERMEDVHQELLTAKKALQSFLQANRQFRNSPELLFQHDDLQREVAMRQEIYTSLLESHERARIDALRDTPLLTTIDSPTGSAELDGRGMVSGMVLAFIVASVLAMLVAFVVEFNRLGRRDDYDLRREFDRLTSEAWKDVRSPSRWLFPWRNKSLTSEPR